MEKNRELLNQLGHNDAVVFEHPSYDEAIIGIDSNERVVYDFEQMAECLMKDDGMSYEDAVEFIEYNTIRALPYIPNSPIVMYGLDEYKDEFVTEYSFDVKKENLHMICQEKLSLSDALTVLKEQFGCQRLTIQSGGTVNALFLRENLIDYVDVIVAPVLIGGKDTATLIDGSSLKTQDELAQLGVLRLIEAETLQNSYVRLRYQVVR